MTDLNLLTALEALLAEGSVAGAARRLGLSPSAMSRTLGRLRAATGDELLVRAGKNMVATPHAEELRERVRGLAQDARAILSPPSASLDLARLEQTFTIRANEDFVEIFSPRVVAAAQAVAPSVRLRFAPKPDKDVQVLRDGLVDLEVGVLGESGPEIRVQALFRDHFVSFVGETHELRQGEVTPERYAAFGHVVVSRRGLARGPIDEALTKLGLTRRVVAVVPSFRAALAIANGSDLIALVTHSFMKAARGFSFPLPVQTEALVISQMWHPRRDADPAHRWLRELVLAACRRFGGLIETLAAGEVSESSELSHGHATATHRS